MGWGDGTAREQRWSTVSGLHAAPAAIHHDGTQRGHPARAHHGGGAGAARRTGRRAGGGAARARGRRSRPGRPAGAAGRREPGGGTGGRGAGAHPGAGPQRRGAAAGRGGPGAGRADPRRAGGRGRRRGRLQPPAARHAGAGRRPGWRRRSTSAWPASRRPGRCSADRPLAEVAAGAGTPTRRTSPGSGPSWPAARRARGCARSSHSSKTTRCPARQPEAMTAQDTKLWHSMSFADADRMIAWLKAIGFTEHATYRDEADPSVVDARRVAVAGRRRDHVRLPATRRRDRQRGRLGGVPRHRRPRRRPSSGPWPPVRPSCASCVDQDYGGRGGSVADPEGNHWSFGDYQPK